MTVQELIDELEKVEDKGREAKINVAHHFGWRIEYAIAEVVTENPGAVYIVEDEES